MDYITCANPNELCAKIGNIEISVIVIILAVIIVIFIYGYIVRNYLHKDVLEQNFASCTGCDYWAGSHFLLFMLLGYMFPDKLLLMMILGIIWEFIETYLGTQKLKLFGRRVVLIGNTNENGETKSNDEDDSWWYGRVTDIAFNLMGLITGYGISEYTGRIKINKIT